MASRETESENIRRALTQAASPLAAALCFLLIWWLLEPLGRSQAAMAGSSAVMAATSAACILYLLIRRPTDIGAWWLCGTLAFMCGGGAVALGLAALGVT